MNAIVLPLALPAPRNRCAAHLPPPLDRPIWLRANVAYRDGCFHEVERFEGRAEWDQHKQEWMTNHGKLAIRNELDAELIILEWEELEDRAKNCDPSATSLSANVYFRGEEWLGDKCGFYAIFDLWHTETCVRLKEQREGPFATQAEAFAALAAMLMVYRHDGSRAERPS